MAATGVVDKGLKKDALGFVFLTPHISTILMGGFSIVWYVGLTLISENIL
jgi:hypothetical protein